LAAPYILHKLRRDAVNYSRAWRDCSPAAFLGLAVGKGLKSQGALDTLLVIAGVCPIVAYRPKPGREEELLRLVPARVPTLRREGLATERAPVILRAKDGTIIEVSEWKSDEAIDAAHRNPAVLAMWNQFFEVCDCVPLNTLAEAG
jgi:quinol monooxygenase YgiN